MLRIFITTFLSNLLFLIIILLIIIFFFTYLKNKLILKNNRVDEKDLLKDKVVIKEINELVEDINFDSLDKKFSLYNLKKSLKFLSKDESIKELILDLESINISKDQVYELMPIFDEIRKTKKIVAIGSNIDNNTYFSALLADEIAVLNTNNNNIVLKGYRYVSNYYKKLLDKLGIRYNVIHIGKYKAIGENYHKEKMSEENRSSLSTIFNTLLEMFLKEIKKRRNIDIEKELLEGKYVLADNDTILKDKIVDKKIKMIEYIKLEEYQSIKQYILSLKNNKKYKKELKKESKIKDVIAVIPLIGTITDKDLSLEKVLNKIDELEEIENLKGVVLRIDSPGGSAFISEQIYRVLKNIKVPIFISMTNVCASGGYYISSISRHSFANPYTITGSIGVAMMYPSFAKTLEKLGILVEDVSKGESSDILDLTKDLTEGNKEKIIQSMERVYREFKNRVINARIISDSELEKIAGGRIFLANKAKEIRLIDGIATLDETIEKLANYLRIKEYRVEYILYKEGLKDKVKNFKPQLLSMLDIKFKNNIQYFEVLNLKNIN